MFRVFGHERIWVLDGGLPRWRASGYDVESSASGDAILKASAASEAIEKVYQGQPVSWLLLQTVSGQTFCLFAYLIYWLNFLLIILSCHLIANDRWDQSHLRPSFSHTLSGRLSRFISDNSILWKLWLKTSSYMQLYWLYSLIPLC